MTAMCCGTREINLREQLGFSGIKFDELAEIFVHSEKVN
jgi:hypothetical protein